MVQTYQSPVRVYKWPFELVMKAYERRFPTCPMIPIFVGSDTVFEYKSACGAEWIIERKCRLNIDAPYILKKIAGVEFVYFVQKNSLNRRKRRLDIEAWNISFSTRLDIKENCVYYVHPENPNWTCFEQSASLNVLSFFGFETAVEKLAVKQYAANLSKGKEIIEYYVNDIFEKKETWPDPFVDPPGFQPLSDTEAALLAHANRGTSRDIAPVLVAGGGVASVPDSGCVDDDEEAEDDDVLTARAADPSTSVSVTGTRQRLTSVSSGDSDHAHRHHHHHHEGGTVPLHRGADRRTSERSIGRRGTITRRGGATSPSGSLVGTLDDADAKLEAEYIHRFLGELTPLEESRLCELKYSLKHNHQGKLPNDAHVLRFLRARDFDVGRARDMLLKSLLWRKQHNVDKLLPGYQPPPGLLQFFPGCWHHEDKEGRPVFVLRLGQLDIKGLLRSIGIDDLVKFTLMICEQGLKRSQEATVAKGVPISTWTLLVDLEGLSMRHLWRPGVQALLRIIEIVEAHYPETMGLLLIVRAPRVFPVLWTLIGPFIDENTRKKFMVHGGSDSTLEELSAYIDERYLPDFVGGSCFCLAPEGGLLPKSMYLPASAQWRGGDDGEHLLPPVYTTANVSKNAPHEVFIPVKIKGCVLTWDFDIAKGQLEFQVLRYPRVLQPTITTHNTTGGGGSAPSSTGGAATSGTTTTTTVAGLTISPSGDNFTTNAATVLLVRTANGATHYLAPSAHQHGPQHVIGAGPALVGPPNADVLFEGERAVVEETPIRFLEGDSMQGSHYCAFPGTYVLQWRQTDADKGHAKVMYYHEVLDSDQFRGSVASLESCKSSFSSLSATMCQRQQSSATGATSSSGIGGGRSSLGVSPVPKRMLPLPASVTATPRYN